MEEAQSLLDQDRRVEPRRENVSTKLLRIAKLAREDTQRALTALAWARARSAAPGTWSGAAGSLSWLSVDPLPSSGGLDYRAAIFLILLNLEASTWLSSQLFWRLSQNSGL